MMQEMRNTLQGTVFFARPELEYELGEVERVAEEFAKDNPKKFKEEFIEKFGSAPMIELTDELWSKLENTESSSEISKGDWARVAGIAEGFDRNWKKPKGKMERGGTVYAPIIVEVGGVLHVVGGNTRLMVARAHGITPKVVLVKMD
jgi:hypothetical protein